MRNPHQVSHLQQVHVSRVLGLERERENKEKGVCTNGSGSKGVAFNMSRIKLLTSKISHICQEICDIRGARKPKSNSLPQNYINTCLDEGRKDQTNIREP